MVVAESSETHDSEEVPTLAYDSAFAKALQAISSSELVKSLPFDPVKYAIPVGVTLGIIMFVVVTFLCVLKCGAK